jgi:hypothetical protein
VKQSQNFDQRRLRLNRNNTRAQSAEGSDAIADM